jgi:hypothetical protein
MSTSAYGINNLYLKPARSGTGPILLQRILPTTSTSAAAWASAAAGAQDDSCVSMVWFDIQVQNIIVTTDGSTPTASNGQLLYVGQNYTWAKTTFAQAKFLNATAGGIITASPMAV